MGTRAELAGALRGILPATVAVIAQPAALANLAPGVTYALMLVRRRVEPGPTMGTYAETFDVLVLEPSQDEARAEDNLDDHLSEVLEILEPLKWAAFRSAERETYADSWPAYRIELQITTTKASTT